MNNKAQLDYPIVALVVLIIGLFLVGPVMLKIFNSIKTPMSNSLGNITSGGAIAQTNYNHVMNTAANLWDKVIIACFVFALILMFVSAFFIDVNPFFIILYIGISFLLIIFAPNIMQSIDQLYGSADFATEVNQLSFMNSLRTYFIEFLVGIMVITGIIIYGKIAFFNSGGTRR